jgi:DNA-binding HxlR family transcriptional regulator
MGASYHQFCPVAKAMELLDERWTLLIVRELIAGSQRFNDVRRGVPRMSPTLPGSLGLADRRHAASRI